MTVQRILPIREFAYRGVGPSFICGRACSQDLQPLMIVIFRNDTSERVLFSDYDN
jgi:hypothetical protein